MYRDKRFRIRPLAEIEREIDEARDELAGAEWSRKVFLADGDALIARASHLEKVLEKLRAAFPSLARVSCYASPQALQVRSVGEMRRLKELGLTQYYLGVESGHDAVLARLQKGVDSAGMIAAAGKATAAGVKLLTMILLGAGGAKLSREHARESARVVNAIRPRFVSTLVMTPVEGTPLMDEAKRGEFVEPEPLETARELREFVAALDVDGTIFRSNHASNWLSVAGTLSKDQHAIVAALDRVLADPDAAPFRDEWMRGL